MSTLPAPKIVPELLRWARERAGKPQEELVAKFEKLPEWESGKAQPTFKQLEAFASAVHVPFGYLFLREPPDERLPIANFRTVRDAPWSRPSPDLIDTLHAMQRRQAWLREFLIECDAGPLPFVASARLADDPDAVGRHIRRTLNLEDGWGAGVHTWQDALNELRRLINGLGVMTAINDVVGNNTGRRLNVGEFHGFALVDQFAPLIFVNGADSKSAQMFTMAHELAHIWLGEGGLSGFERLLPGGTDVEDWCNRAAAEFLVPAGELQDRWEEVRRIQHPFDALGRPFRVSPVVAARRAMDLNLIDCAAFFEFHEHYSKREQRCGPPRGNFHDIQNARVGERFATFVMRAAKEGQISFKEAYALTDLQGGAFQDYAGRLGIRIP